MKTVSPDLRILLIEITQKCNARCDQCGSRCDIHSEENLKAKEIVSVFRDVKEHIGTDVMLNITGGEPLMRKDLFEIMEKAHEMGFDWGMVTNGTLITDEVIDQMKRTGMKTITISIDGLRETHEELRHLPGSYDKIMENLKKLKKAKFLDHLQVTFTSNKKNYREFPALYEELSAVGIDSVRTSCIDPIGRAVEYPELLLGVKELQFLYNFANKKNAEKGLPIVWGCCHYTGKKLDHRKFLCFAGIHAASILFNGDIFVCPNVPRRPELIQGNIRNDRFSEVWEKKFEWFRNRPLPSQCEDCVHRKECKGDSVHTFDFDNGKPLFCYKELFEQQTSRYKRYLKKRYGDYHLVQISGDEPAPQIYFEPEAYEELSRFFHMGARHPLSMFEQQMGLVGFMVDENYVIKYVFPATINTLAADAAVFEKNTLSHAKRQTDILRYNHKKSDFGRDYIGSGLKFLGFAHSHPVQEELCYSIGDEKIHEHLTKKFGDYIGILIHPESDSIGAYIGKPIIQGDLRIIIPEQKK